MDPRTYGQRRPASLEEARRIPVTEIGGRIPVKRVVHGRRLHAVRSLASRCLGLGTTLANVTRSFGDSSENLSGHQKRPRGRPTNLLNRASQVGVLPGAPGLHSASAWAG